MIPLAHAADLSAASSRDLTQPTALLLGILLLVLLGAGLASWRHRSATLAARREADVARRQADDRLRRIAAPLGIAFFEFDPATGRFAAISDGVQPLFGVSPADVLQDPGRIDCRLGGGPPPWRQAETTGSSIWEGPLADGSRWLQIRSSPGLSSSGQPVIEGVMIDITASHHAEAALALSREEIRQLSAHREARIEAERARLAREVHDELGQLLTAARMQLQLLRSELGDSERLAAADALLGDAYHGVKQVAADLRPGPLNLGLTAAVEWLAERLLAPAGIVCEIRFAPVADKLDDGRATALFRIVQEALANVVRHAGARQVVLSLEQAGEGLRLQIADDGCGFDPAAVDRRQHFGLLGIAERCGGLGGRVTVDSAPAAGTRIVVELAP